MGIDGGEVGRGFAQNGSRDKVEVCRRGESGEKEGV